MPVSNGSFYFINPGQEFPIIVKKFSCLILFKKVNVFATILRTEANKGVVNTASKKISLLEIL